ncbi:GNAT family N-acetyltransferase [Micromonospora sp. NPDC049060]|uniref:GNAT family N-acetyltransferase n=1 Tax=Micromonospora sp. NPDC049060 TaxID=3154828 RepID=UPI00340A3136
MSDVIFREAVRADLPAVIALLADDVLGRTRDFTEVDAAYEKAFADIDADPRNQLIVADADGELLGCMQLTYIPGLGRHGAERQLIEAVRVRSDLRGRGLGRQMITWAVDQAKQRGCALVQLTTDKTRQDAHRFYVNLGFLPTHEGMKLPLSHAPAIMQL